MLKLLHPNFSYASMARTSSSCERQWDGFSSAAGHGETLLSVDELLKGSRINALISCYRTGDPGTDFFSPGQPNASSISTPS